MRSMKSMIHRLLSRPRLAALSCSLLAALAAPVAAAPVASQGTLSTNLQDAAPVAATWDPLLDALTAQPPSPWTAAPAGVSLPRAASPGPSFGGLRAAPSTPAHAAGDATRDLSSAEADFDRDGCQDIVTFQVANLTVMRGDCKGGFTKLQSQAAPLNVYHPVAVDLDHDGYPDIVAMTAPFGYAGTVVALLNRQNATFGAATVISRKASLYSGLMAMNVYDINGDGNADVIVAGIGTVDTMTNSNSVFEVIFGNADGSFGTATLVETDGVLPYKPSYAYDGGSALRKIGDQLYFYGLLLQSQRVNGTAFGSEVLYRWAVSSAGVVDVDHPLITPLPVLSVSPNKYMQFADLDGDGIDDFTLLNGDGMLYTAPGASDGSFGALRYGLPVTAGNNAAVVAFRDVDGDGKVDAILAGAVFLGTWPGNGDGTFRAPKITYHGGYAINGNSGLTFPVTNHVIDDFDGDGIADVAFFDTVKRALCFYRGRSDGTFIGAPVLVSTTGAFQSNNLALRAAGDLNGDGYQDIVVGSPFGLLGGISNGAGDFTYQILSPLQGIAAISSQTADFDRDGKDDVVFLSTDQNSHVHLYVGLSNGDGTVRAVAQPLPFSSVYAPGLAIGDINGDGAPDLLVALNDYATPSYAIWPMVNDGKGGLAAAPRINVGVALYAIAAADVNGDGQADLFVSYGSYSTTTTAVYLATGSGGFATTAAVLQHTLPGGAILARDVTGDGIVDAVVSVLNGASEGLMLYRGHGDGTFDAGAPVVTGVVPTYVGTADLNGDALPDLYFTTTEGVLTDAADGLMGLVVLLGAGDGSFAPPAHYAIYSAAAPVLPIDMFHDGAASLLASAGGSTVVLLNNGGSTVTLTAGAASVGSADPVSVTVRVTPGFADQPLPTGYVAVRVDGAVADRGAVRSNGTASFTLSALEVGSHVVSASYEGDDHYNVNLHSNTVDLKVGKATPAFQLTSDAAQLALSAAGSASSAISLSANHAFSGPVTLSCDGAPAATTCAFSQPSVTLAPGQTVTSMLTLTAAKTASLRRSILLGSSGAGLAAAWCLLVMVPGLRRRAGSARRLLPVLMYLGAVAGCAANPAAPPNQRAGSYAITVTATPSDPSVPPQTLTMVVVDAP